MYPSGSLEFLYKALGPLKLNRCCTKEEPLGSLVPPFGSLFGCYSEKGRGGPFLIIYVHTLYEYVCMNIYIYIYIYGIWGLGRVSQYSRVHRERKNMNGTLGVYGGLQTLRASGSSLDYHEQL